MADQDTKDLLKAVNKLIEFFRYQFKPQNAIDFDEYDSLSISNTTSGDQVVVTFTVPKGCKGVLKWVGQDADQVNVFAGNSIWNVKINGMAVPTWSQLTTQKATTMDPSPETIALNENDVIDLTCNLTNSANINLPVNVLGRIRGWYWVERNDK